MNNTTFTFITQSHHSLFKLKKKVLCVCVCVRTCMCVGGRGDIEITHKHSYPSFDTFACIHCIHCSWHVYNTHRHTSNFLFNHLNHSPVLTIAYCWAILHVYDSIRYRLLLAYLFGTDINTDTFWTNTVHSATLMCTK